MTPMSGLFSALAGLITGVLSAWGIGGGSLLILYMSVVEELPQQLSQGINLLYFVPTSLSALYSHLKNGLVDKKAAWPAIAAGVAATLAAAFAATSLHTGVVRKIFGVFIIFIGLTELLRKSAGKEHEK